MQVGRPRVHPADLRGSDPRAWSPADRVGAALAGLAVLVLGALDARTDALTISTIGLVPVVAALVLRFWAVVYVAATAVLVAVAVALVADVQQELLRLGNVVLGAALAVAGATARAARTRDLRRLQQRDELVLASIEEGVYGLDGLGRVTFANAAVERLLGYRERDLLGRVMHDLVHHSHPDGTPYPAEDCPMLRARDGQVVGPVLGDVLWDAAGRPVQLDVVARPADDGAGPPSPVVVSMRDARPRLAAEADRDRLLRLQVEHEVEREEHQRIVGALERALLPGARSVPGGLLDVAHLPVEDGAPTGGDLYDVLLLPDGSAHLLVVDVAGHGVESTRDALRVVHTARALVLQDVPPQDLVGRLDRLLGSTGEEVTATLVVARWCADGRVVVASGGHMPPLVVRADGATSWLEADGRPVGYPLAGSDGAVEVQLAPGDSLVLYTDGVVEGDRDVVAGLAALSSLAAARAGEPLEGWARRLAGDLLDGAARRDDSLVVAVRRTA